MSLPLVYNKQHFLILRANKEYIVLNTKKEFEVGHTHIRNKRTAKYLIDCALKKRIPKSFSYYLLTSLQRISTDDKYIQKIEKRKEVIHDTETLFQKEKA